jgi:uncharacterized repeat protein (TIGR01451 family)
VLLLALGALPVFGETNQATGDIAGVAGDLVDSNVFTLTSSGTPLNLVKRAYLPDGTRVATSSTLPAGSVVDFLIYISNDTTVQINDISLQDVLDPAFVYQSGTIRVDNNVANCAAAVCTPAEEDNLHSVLEPQPGLNDAVDGDVASYSPGTTTIDFGNQNQANLQLNILGQRVWAALVRVTVP